MKRQYLFLLFIPFLTSCTKDVSLAKAKAFADSFNYASFPYISGKEVSYYSFYGVGNYANEKIKEWNDKGIYNGNTYEEIIDIDTCANYKISSSYLDFIANQYGEKITYTIDDDKLNIKKIEKYISDELTYSINLLINYDQNGFLKSYSLVERYNYSNNEYYYLTINYNYHWNSAYIY